MKNLDIREIRELLGKLDNLVEQEQELIVTRNKQAIARILPEHPAKPRQLARLAARQPNRFGGPNSARPG